MNAPDALTFADVADLSRWDRVITARAVFRVSERAPIAVTLEEILQMDDSTRRIIIRHNDHMRAHPQRAGF